jgi:hypothetical protein
MVIDGCFEHTGTAKLRLSGAARAVVSDFDLTVSGLPPVLLPALPDGLGVSVRRFRSQPDESSGRGQGLIIGRRLAGNAQAIRAAFSLPETSIAGFPPMSLLALPGRFGSSIWRFRPQPDESSGRGQSLIISRGFMFFLICCSFCYC